MVSDAEGVTVMTKGIHPLALGTILLELRRKYEVSKYAIAHSTGGIRPLNHGLISRIELGDCIAPTYETLQRIMDGMDAASQRGALGAGTRKMLFETAFADRITYEAGKFAVYYLYLLDDTDAPLHPALERLRAMMLEEFPYMGEDNPDAPRPIPGTAQGKGRTAIRGVRHEHVNLRTATGFEAVRVMAETQEAHHLRMGLLVDVVPWLTMDWEGEQLRLGQGDLVRATIRKSGGDVSRGAAAPSDTTDTRIVQLFADQEDEQPQ
jgi:hypothetical protein